MKGEQGQNAKRKESQYLCDWTMDVASAYLDKRSPVLLPETETQKGLLTSNPRIHMPYQAGKQPES